MVETEPQHITDPGRWLIEFTGTEFAKSSEIDTKRLRTWYEDMGIVRYIIGNHADELTPDQMDSIWA